MKVVLGEHAGFCFGVERAVNMVYQEAQNGQATYTLGHIIHNESVVNELKEKGVLPISYEEALEVDPATVVVRSHGVGENIIKGLLEAGHRVVDATCPFVAKIQSLVREHSENGEHIAVIGKAAHAEIMGVVGWIVGEEYTVIETEDEAKAFSAPMDKKVFIVVQTTFNNNKFRELVEIIKQKGYDVDCINTICKATEDRQQEAAQIATQVDAMIVIGGKDSSNTKELFKICQETCNHTVMIQSAKDLDLTTLISKETVGITAGASTPKKIIREVLMQCQR